MAILTTREIWEEKVQVGDIVHAIIQQKEWHGKIIALHRDANGELETVQAEQGEDEFKFDWHSGGTYWFIDGGPNYTGLSFWRT